MNRAFTLGETFSIIWKISPHFLHTELYANFLALRFPFNNREYIVFCDESSPSMKMTSCKFNFFFYK